MAIYGNDGEDKKPGQHCIGSRESAQESCSGMPAPMCFYEEGGVNATPPPPILSQLVKCQRKTSGKVQTLVLGCSISSLSENGVLGCFAKVLQMQMTARGGNFQGLLNFNFAPLLPMHLTIACGLSSQTSKFHKQNRSKGPNKTKLKSKKTS